jgi:hypothetical protein
VGVIYTITQTASGDVPQATIVEGTYTVTFSYQGDWEFDVDVVKYDDTYYKLSTGGWLGWSGLDMPILLGTADAGAGTISFDGTELYNGEIDTSAAGSFGSCYYWADQAQTQLIALFGGGDSGTEPIVLTFDGQGYITSISQVILALVDYPAFTVAGIMDMMPSGEMTYVGPVGGAAAVASAPAKSNGTITALPTRFATKAQLKR